MLEKKESFEIKKAIIHVLEIGKPVYSTQLLSLKKDDPFYKFLEKHITSSLLSSKRKSAKFNNIAGNATARHSQALITSTRSDKFVKESTSIASLLYHEMYKTTPKSSDVVVAQCRKDNGETFLALFMLDFTNSIFHKVKKDSHGRNIVEFIGDIKTLPTDKKLLKVAFIREFNAANAYHLIVDKGSLNVKYFFDEFLNAEHIFNDNELIQKLYNCFSKFAIQYGYNHLLDKYLDILETDSSIIIENFIASNITKPSDLAIIKQMLHDDNIIEKEIEIDYKYVEENYRRQVIRLDNGITIRIPLAYKETVVIDDDEKEITITEAEVISTDLLKL